MKPFRGRIGLVGAGALGCFYGSRLSRAGHDVHFLMRRDYEAVRARGLTIHSVDGDFHIHPPVYKTAKELGRCDLVILGLKTTDNAALEGLLAEVAGPETLVLTLQNGLGNEEAVARVLAGQEGARRGVDASACGPQEALARVLGGVAFLCSTRGEPGHVHHTAYGWMRLAEARGPAVERTHEIAELFRSAGIEVEECDSLAYIRWAKLVWNIPFNGLGVGAGYADTQVILHDAELLAAARGLMEETLRAARADGAEIEPSFAQKMIDVTAAMGPYKSSMQVDYEAGRPLEVEAILGEPCRRAQRAGIAVPRLEMLYGIVRRLDRLRTEKSGGDGV